MKIYIIYTWKKFYVFISEQVILLLQFHPFYLNFFSISNKIFGPVATILSLFRTIYFHVL